MGIVTENLVKNYGKTEALKGINLNVPDGSIYGFIGRNGAGKSTLIRCLLNLIFPTSGRAEINGLDCVKDSDKIKKIVAYVPSETALPNVTVETYLKFALTTANAFDQKQFDETTKKLELDINKKISELSLGNRKKVSLCFALLKKPELIILDEPTSGLDPVMQELFFEMLLKEKQRGVTVFLSSHNLNEVEKYCERAALIREGRILKEFDVNEMRAKSKHKATYTLVNGETVCEQFDDINGELKKLSKLKIKQCEIVLPSLEEQVIELYRSEEHQL